MEKFNLEFINAIVKENLDNRLEIVVRDDKFYLKRIDNDQEIEISKKAIERLSDFADNVNLALLHFLYALKVPYFQIYKNSRFSTYYENSGTEYTTVTDEELRIIEGKMFLHQEYRRRGIPEIYRVSYSTYEENVTYVVFIPLISAEVEVISHYEKRVRGRRVKAEKYVYYKKWDGWKLVENRCEVFPLE
jgi:hypothetical protein